MPLVPAQGSNGVAKASRDIVLIRVARFKERDHGIGFGRTIFDGVVRNYNALNGDHTLLPLCAETYTIVHEGRAGHRSGPGEEFPLLRGWFHDSRSSGAPSVLLKPIAHRHGSP